MQVDTRFGKVEVDPDTVLTFPQGLPGFENLTRFTLLHEEGATTIFWLQSVEDPDVQFSVTDPNSFRVNYQVTLQDDETALLELTDVADAAVMVMLSRDEATDPSGIKANFMAPLVINTKSRKGLQKALNQIEGFVNIVAE